MKGYLGIWEIEKKYTKFKDYKKTDWAMYFIYCYGAIDGSHHKDWVLDQVTRILKGTPIIIKIAAWENGQTEYRISTGKKSKKYKKYVKKCRKGGYSYEKGIPP